MITIGWVQLPAPHLDGIGRIVQCVHCEVDIGPTIPRRRPASGNKVPDVVGEPLIGTRWTARSLPSNDVVYDHAILGPGEELLSGDHLDDIFLAAVREVK